MPEELDITQLERKRFHELRKIWTSMDSPDAKIMYSAAGKMMAHPAGKPLLPKAVDLFDAEDMTIRRLMFRTAARSVFGDYVTTLFASFGNITPAEREQILQVIEERFQYEDAPQSLIQQKIWVNALEKLGREHQPTIFGIMAYLGRPGKKWVTERIKNHVESITFGAVQQLTLFSKATQKRLIQLIIRKSLERKRELIPFVLDILDKKTIHYAELYLKNGNWRERVLVATRCGKVGVSSCTGMVLDILADSDWRVKQALLENVSLSKSKFSAVIKLLGYVATDSHTRVRGAAERLILRLGIESCIDTDIETQRKRIQRKFRKQLLRAAPVNKDIDSSWLGIEITREATIPYIEETNEEEPEGLSLEEISSPSEPNGGTAPAASSLLAALKNKRASVTQNESTAALADRILKTDETQTIEDKIVEALKKLSKELGKDVPLDALCKELVAAGISNENFESTLADLERDGIIYQSGKGTVSYVDIDL